MISFLFSRRSTLFIIFSVLCVILYTNSHAYAEESLICADDIEKYCKGVKPGGGRILNCLKAHEAELTVSCRGKMSELQGIIKDCEQACAGDIAQFCKEVQPGGGRIVKCLKEHDKELSSSCKAKLEMIGKRYQRREE
jgi:Cysteine rich repeat